MTKSELKATLGFTTDKQVADLFGITASAVSLWPHDGPIPELRQLQLPKLRPDVFGTKAA